jgi:transcriptional regulator with XRE-family HTH domain
LQRLTAAQIADRAGVSRDTLRKLERGETTVGLDVFLNVARVLGTLDRMPTLSIRRCFLRDGRSGWRLSPAFDLNPNPEIGMKRVTGIGGRTTRGRVDRSDVVRRLVPARRR